jgi:hypothetical protein
MVLESNGTVVVWGQNDFGEISGATNLTDIVAIAAGTQHSLALKKDGTVVAWGINNCGQSVVPPGLTDVVAVAAGYCHSLALKRDGTVVGWGENGTAPPNATNVVALGGGYAYSLALKRDGEVVAWGENGLLQATVPPGLSNVTAIAAGGFHNLALVGSSTFCSPRKARATPQLVNEFVVGATITDGGCGYTNAPVVLIQGGGGTGATATATVIDGRVTAIRIISAGCCYASPPSIVIGSPPFIPTLNISVSKVRVSQNVVLGRRYLLQSSDDLANWTATGPAFTAESENVENEFAVGVTGRFFRIREVP